MRFIEYDLATGRIISEIECDSEPWPVDGTGLLQIGDNEEIDTIDYAVRNGALVKVSETSQERLERERIRREHGEQCKKRLKSLIPEIVIAMLDSGTLYQLFPRDERIKALCKEYSAMKAYL